MLDSASSCWTIAAKLSVRVDVNTISPLPASKLDITICNLLAYAGVANERNVVEEVQTAASSSALM